MIAILLVGLIACASAAPGCRHPHRDYSHLSPFDGSLDRFLEEQMHDTNRFLDEMNRNLNRDMMQLERTLADVSRDLPNMVSTEGIEGNEYKIVIPLTGFEEKDIVVKARKGTLVIEAVHNDAYQNQNSYLNVRGLPMSVGEQGTWSYENGVLKIYLPVNQGGDSGTKLTPVTFSPVPDPSREETESATSDGGHITDIDLVRDLDNEKQLKTNEIPNVEATTYAVDVNGDVTFVPVPYKK